MIRRTNLKFWTVLVLLSLLFSISGCGKIERGKAILHDTGDLGYIEYVPASLSFAASAEQIFIYDVTLGKMIYLRGEDEIVFPASTTKLLSAIVALDILSPDYIVTPGDELSMVKAGSSLAYIKPYHRISVEMLVEAMMLPSGNDAAYVLAASAGRAILEDSSATGAKAVEAFVARMNSYGKSVGLCGSSFTAPDGYFDKNHHTTLEDIAIICRMASENEMISKYVAMASDDVVYASGHTNRWVNTNKMLDENSEFYSEYVSGMKTGFTKEGGYCLIIRADDGERSFIIGIFAAQSADSRFFDAKAIVDVLF